MATRLIAKDGDDILRKKAKPVKEITPRIKLLCEDMVDTMLEADGVGLAAPQISVLKRIFVAKPYTDSDEIFYMINPEMLETIGEQDSLEGCLSVPGCMGDVKRPETVKIKATDLDGNTNEYEFSGLAATVMCHEYDHLNGILYTDKATHMYTPEELEELFSAEDGEEAGEERVAVR